MRYALRQQDTKILQQVQDIVVLNFTLIFKKKLVN